VTARVDRTGIVLCGGRSSRMGRPKAWLPWFGTSMIEHVVDRLLPVVDEVVVVASEELSLPPLAARIVRDRTPGLGPLAGIRFGLEAARGEFAFVTSVDAPYLTKDHVLALFELHSAAAPVVDEHVQVLSAVYPCAAWREAERLLSGGVRRPLRLLEALDYVPLPAKEGDGPAAWDGFNTPGEYLDAVRRQAPNAVARVELLGRSARKRATSRTAVPVGTLGEVLSRIPGCSFLIDGDRVSKGYVVSIGGRDLVRDLSIPVGPDEAVSVVDALAGG